MEMYSCLFDRKVLLPFFNAFLLTLPIVGNEFDKNKIIIIE
jgi:hypothetical protein